MSRKVWRKADKKPQYHLGPKAVWIQIKYFWVLPGFSQTGSGSGQKPAVYRYSHDSNFLMPTTMAKFDRDRTGATKAGGMG